MRQKLHRQWKKVLAVVLSVAMVLGVCPDMSGAKAATVQTVTMSGQVYSAAYADNYWDVQLGVSPAITVTGWSWNADAWSVPVTIGEAQCTAGVNYVNGNVLDFFIPTSVGNPIDGTKLTIKKGSYDSAGDEGTIRIEKEITAAICKLGTSNFVMSGTNCLVQVVCNTTLQTYGGDLFIGVMTVANSVREVFNLPVSGLIGGAQPVISYNYGAKDYDRVKSGIRFNTAVGIAYTLVAWIIVVAMPELWFRIFSDDAQLLQSGVQMLKIYFFGFVFMSLQFSGQSVFQSLGDAKHAIFFSLLRKAFIVVPLTLLLPAVGFGVTGVFLAEPISNIIGGIACFTTMRMTIYKKLNQK